MWRSEDNLTEVVSLSTIMWVLGIELSRLCAVCTFTLWVISPAFKFTFSEGKLIFGSLSEENLQEFMASLGYIKRTWRELDKEEEEKEEKGEEEKERIHRGKKGRSDPKTPVNARCL